MLVKRIIATTAAAAALLATGATTATSAAAGPGDLAPAPFDTAAMAQSIEQALGNGRTVGYAYAIAVNGQYATSGADGKAQTGPDGDLDMTATTRMEIASSTKNFTAAAVLKLLEANGLSVETKVKAYLPATFQQEADASWNAVSFRHLLSHTSGLEQMEQGLTQAEKDANWSTLYPGLRYAVNRQITAPSTRLYSNMNYAMLRLTIPALWRIDEPGRGVPVVNQFNSGAWALNYVNEKLLAPAGIAPTSCLWYGGPTALAYNATNTAAGGAYFQLGGADFEACAGHRGLRLSAMDLVRWQAHLAHGTVVSASVRNLMDSLELGWQPGSNGATTAGMYWHDGDLSSNGRQLHTCHAKFPGGVEASVVMNSQNLGGVSECQVLINAFNAATN